MIHYGYQTIVFGSQLRDLRSALQLIAAAGFQGVEISQHPSSLFCDGVAASYGVLEKEADRAGLTILGLAGGSLHSRMAYCENGRSRPLYLYLDEYRPEEMRAALNREFRLALHPHIFRSLDNMAEIEKLVERYPPHLVSIMPDTAHIYIRGYDPVDEIRKRLNRTVCVHLKDWTSAYGHSPLRFAKGFVPLGEGEVPVRETVAMLEEEGYQGWLVAEQDYSRNGAASAIYDSANFLAIQPRTVGLEYPATRVYTSETLATATIAAQEGTLEECYSVLAKTILRLNGAVLVAISACSPNVEDIILLSYAAVDDTTPMPPITYASKGSTLMGAVMDEGIPQSFVLQGADTLQPSLLWQEYATSLGARSGIAIPISLKHNPHYVKLGLLMLFGETHRALDDAMVTQMRQAICDASEVSLEQNATYASSVVGTLALKSKTSKDFLSRLTSWIKKAVGCEGVTVFMTNLTEDQLSVVESTGILWKESRLLHFYTKDDLPDRIVNCWLYERPYVISDSSRRVATVDPVDAHSTDIVAGSAESLLITPIRHLASSERQFRASRAIGVVRCTNKLSAGSAGRGHKLFTEDDLAILDAICQVAAPYIELRRLYELRFQGISRIAHELKGPINSLHNEVRYTELLTSRYCIPYLDHDQQHAVSKSFSDVYALTDLAVGYVDNARIYGFGGRLRLQPVRVGLIGDIIAPAKGQVRFLLDAAGLDSNQIRYDAVDSIPKLFLDKNRFQQVCFNLLMNAIKYRWPQGGAFEVNIRTIRADDGFIIRFEDYGVGIEEKYREIIFEDGIRGPSHHTLDVDGLGIGLHIVRQIVVAHGGRVSVTRCERPTTIDIWLPRVLESGFPKGLLRQAHG